MKAGKVLGVILLVSVILVFLFHSDLGLIFTGSPVLNVEPSEVNVMSSNRMLQITFSVSVVNVQNLAAWQISLVFEPGYLEGLQAVLPSDNIFSGVTVFGPYVSFSQDRGLTCVACCSGVDAAFSGSGKLVDLKATLAGPIGSTVHVHINKTETMLLNGQIEEMRYDCGQGVGLSLFELGGGNVIHGAWHCSPIHFFTVSSHIDFGSGQSWDLNPRTQYDVPNMLQEVENLLGIEITDTGVNLYIHASSVEDAQQQWNRGGYGEQELMLTTREWGPAIQFCSIELIAVPEIYPGSSSSWLYGDLNDPVFSYPLWAHVNTVNTLLGTSLGSFTSYEIARTALAHELGHLAFGSRHCTERSCIMGLLIPNYLQPWDLCSLHRAESQNDFAFSDLLPEKTIFSYGLPFKASLQLQGTKSLHYNLEMVVDGNREVDTNSYNLIAPNDVVQVEFTVPRVSDLYVSKTVKFSVSDAHESDKNNNVIQKTIIITKPGDINCDRLVNMKDIAAIAHAFLSQRGQSLYNPDLDLNSDLRIDMKDIAVPCRNFAP